MTEKTLTIPASILQAQNITYDNSSSSLSATDVQTAIDEIKDSIIESVDGTGYSLELTIDDYFIITINLLDKNGNILSTQTLDLPIESTVMDAKYAEGILTLILQNGNETPIDVSDLIDGLVSESRTIAGIDLVDDITAEELEQALGVDAVKENVSHLQIDMSDLLSAEDITSTTETTMPNSCKGRLLFDEIGGVCKQASTTGKNLYDYTKSSIRDSNSTINSTKDGVINITSTDTMLYGMAGQGSTSAITAANLAKLINVTEGKIYTFSYETDVTFVKKCYVHFYDESGNSVTNASGAHWTIVEGTSVTVTAPAGAYAMNCNVQIDSITEETTFNIWNIQVEEGEVVTEYESYTGGIASPNPDYPQEIYTVKGKNLLDCRGLEESTINGVTFTPAYDDKGNLLYVEANGTATATVTYNLTTAELPKGNYILNGTASGSTSSTYHIYTKVGDTTLYDLGSGMELSLSEKSSVKPVIYVASGQTVTNLRFYPMIRSTSVSDSTYVPYGLMRVKTHGAQLLSPVNTSNSKWVLQADSGYKMGTDGATTIQTLTLPAGTYTLSVETVNNSGSIPVLIFRNPDTLYNYATNYVSGLNYCTYTFDEETTVDILLQSINSKSEIPTVGCVAYVMLNSGETVLPWEPYTESSIILSEPIELCGIDDVQDVIDIENGFFKKQFGKLVCDGSEEWVTSTYSTTRYGLRLQQASNGLCMCSAARYGRNSADTFKCSLNQDGNFYINTLFESLEEWTTYLTDNPMTIIYELSDKEITDLPTADCIALNSMPTYDSATYLEWDCYLEPTFAGQYGTSKVGGTTLEGLLSARNAGLDTSSISISDSIDAATVNEHTVESDVPADAVFTDTVYDDSALSERVTEVEEQLGTVLTLDSTVTVNTNKFVIQTDNTVNYEMNTVAQGNPTASVYHDDMLYSIYGVTLYVSDCNGTFDWYNIAVMGQSIELVNIGVLEIQDNTYIYFHGIDGSISYVIFDPNNYTCGATLNTNVMMSNIAAMCQDKNIIYTLENDGMVREIKYGTVTELCTPALAEIGTIDSIKVINNMLVIRGLDSTDTMEICELFDLLAGELVTVVSHGSDLNYLSDVCYYQGKLIGYSAISGMFYRANGGGYFEPVQESEDNPTYWYELLLDIDGSNGAYVYSTDNYLLISAGGRTYIYDSNGNDYRIDVSTIAVAFERPNGLYIKPTNQNITYRIPYKTKEVTLAEAIASLKM